MIFSCFLQIIKNNYFFEKKKKLFFCFYHWDLCFLTKKSHFFSLFFFTFFSLFSCFLSLFVTFCHFFEIYFFFQIHVDFWLFCHSKISFISDFLRFKNHFFLIKKNKIFLWVTFDDFLKRKWLFSHKKSLFFTFFDQKSQKWMVKMKKSHFFWLFLKSQIIMVKTKKVTFFTFFDQKKSSKNTKKLTFLIQKVTKKWLFSCFFDFFDIFKITKNYRYQW